MLDSNAWTCSETEYTDPSWRYIHYSSCIYSWKCLNMRRQTQTHTYIHAYMHKYIRNHAFSARGILRSICTIFFLETLIFTFSVPITRVPACIYVYHGMSRAVRCIYISVEYACISAFRLRCICSQVLFSSNISSPRNSLYLEQ